MTTQQTDPIIQKYIDLVKANTSVFKAFYAGDPIVIPVSMMPALVVAKRQSTVTKTTNVEDIHMVTLVLTVVTDIRKDISDETTLVPGNATLYDIIEGRDPVTYLLKPQSLLYILRHNLGIDPAHQIYTDINTPTKIDYGMVMNKRQAGSWSIEGAITAVASIVQLR